MTAFVPANIPSSVTTIEELVVWSASALAEVNPAVTIQVSSGELQRAAQVQTFDFKSQVTNPERAVVIAYIPLTASWRSSGKIWASGVGEISNAALPAGYTTN